MFDDFFKSINDGMVHDKIVWMIAALVYAGGMLGLTIYYLIKKIK